MDEEIKKDETATDEVLPVEPTVEKNEQDTDEVAVSETTEEDVFLWANNIVQYKDELKIDLFFIGKNYTLYKASISDPLKKQLEPIFIDEILEYMLEGADVGLVVRAFEEAEAEFRVLQRTNFKNVAPLKETMNWLWNQYSEIPIFSDEEHDFKRIRGVMARVQHDDLEKPFYVYKVLPQSKIMKGKTGWMLKGGKFVQFDAEAALQIPTDPQLLLLGEDLFVFNQSKLKALFGYDAKEAAIAKSKVAEIESNFKLAFDEGMDLNKMVEGKKALIKKLQKLDPSMVKQEDLLDHAEEMGVELMQDESGAIIIMDDKDATKFINLLNDDYVESPLTGMRYEIVNKKALKAIEPDS